MGAKRVARDFLRLDVLWQCLNISNSVKASRALPLMFAAPGCYTDFYDTSSRKSLVLEIAFEF